MFADNDYDEAEDLNYWSVPEICTFTSSTNKEEYNTKHFPEIESFILDGNVTKEVQHRGDALSPIDRDPLDLGFEFEEDDLGLIPECDYRDLIRNDFQDLKVNHSHVDSLIRDLPIRGHSFVCLKRDEQNVIHSLQPELDSTPPKFSPPGIYDRLKHVKPLTLRHKYRDSKFTRDYPECDGDPENRYHSKPFTPKSETSRATLIYVHDKDRYSAQLRINQAMTTPELTGMAMTNSTERAGILLAYGFSVITSSPVVYHDLKDVHNHIILNYRGTFFNSRHVIYTHTSIDLVIQLLFIRSDTLRQPAKLISLAALRLAENSPIECDPEIEPSIDSSYINSIRFFKYRRRN